VPRDRPGIIRVRVNIEGIIAVIGFALAAYSILPRWRQLDLAFRFRWLDGVLVTAGIAGLLYLQFFPILAALGRTPRLGLARWNITTEMAASVLISTVSVLLFLHMRTMALHPYRIARFARLVDELIQAKEYAALFTLLDGRYIERLWRVAYGRNGLQRLRRWLMKGRLGWDHEHNRMDFTDVVILIDEEERKPPEKRKPIKQISRFRDAVAPRMGRMIPKRLVDQEGAQAILSRIFTSDEVMRELVTIRPEVLLPILRQREKHYEFLDEFLRHLLRAPGSALYRHLAATQVVERGHNYRIEPEGELLDILIGDAGFVEEHGLWQPIAQEALAMFTELRRNPETDPYNVSYDEWFRVKGRWQMPFFIVIHYFDIMVSRALNQGQMHHMWLSYFGSFVEHICENYHPIGPDYDPKQEFPTRYSFLLYQVFDALVDWIRAVREMPRQQKNIQLTEIDAEYNEEHIPKAAVRALARSLRVVLTCGTLEERFKIYLADMVFHAYFDLRQHGPRPYADLLLFFLTHDGYGGRNHPYGQALAAALEESDTYFVMQYRELEEAIADYNGPP
jgi:hypothetical protein